MQLKDKTHRWVIGTFQIGEVEFFPIEAKEDTIIQLYHSISLLFWGEILTTWR